MVKPTSMRECVKMNPYKSLNKKVTSNILEPILPAVKNDSERITSENQSRNVVERKVLKSVD